MLAKMKLESGYQFTLKLEGMFKDMKTSADAMDAYREWVKNRTVSSFFWKSSLLVLTPFSKAPTPTGGFECYSHDNYALADIASYSAVPRPPDFSRNPPLLRDFLLLSPQRTPADMVVGAGSR